MKNYLVAYKTSPFITRSATVRLRNAYKLSSDDGLLELRHRLYKQVKPKYESVYAAPSSSGGRVDSTEYADIPVDKIELIAITPLED